MNGKRVVALVAGALVAGLTLGWAATGIAATVAPNTSSAAACGGQLGLGATMRESGSRLLDIVADLTGLGTDEVVAQRQDGKSFSEIAEGANVSSDQVVDAATAAREAAVADAVASGQITQEQADAALAAMESRITDRVQSTNTNCDGTGSGGGRGMMGGNGGGRGQGCGGTCAVTQ